MQCVYASSRKHGLTHWGREKWAPFSRWLLKWIFLNENVWISINDSLNFLLRGPINTTAALVQFLPPVPWYKYFITNGLRHQNITHCHKRVIPKTIYIAKITYHFNITRVMQDGHSTTCLPSIITLYISRVLTIVTAIPPTHRIDEGNCSICLQ